MTVTSGINGFYRIVSKKLEPEREKRHHCCANNRFRRWEIRYSKRSNRCSVEVRI